MVRNNLGYKRVEDGDASPQVVARGSKEAAAALPDDPNVVDTLGWLRYKQGRFEDEDGAAGGRFAARAGGPAGSTPPGPEVLLHLGDAQWRAGAHSEAIATWRRLLEAHATSMPRSRNGARSIGSLQSGNVGGRDRRSRGVVSSRVRRPPRRRTGATRCGDGRPGHRPLPRPLKNCTAAASPSAESR